MFCILPLFLRGSVRRHSKQKYRTGEASDVGMDDSGRGEVRTQPNDEGCCVADVMLIANKSKYPHDTDCERHSPCSQCPLCRTPFESRSIIKPHIDTESVQRESPKAQSPSVTAAEQEVRRLQDATAATANTGSSEAILQALIEECRKFLAGQPRSMVGVIYKLPLPPIVN